MARTTHRFFRAQGKAACFIAENDGRVVGALGTAIRTLWLPDGNECKVAYFGDLKIAKDSRGGVVLMRFARAAEGWLRPRFRQDSVWSWAALPDTRGLHGRAGIPDFKELGRLTILRISGGNENRSSDQMLTTQETGLECYDAQHWPIRISSEFSGGTFGINAGLVDDPGWLGLRFARRYTQGQAP